MLTPGERLPYPGLRAFQRDEAHLFFGRERCVDEMIGRLAGARFLAVLGASGSGKSSLVRPGLLSSLELGFFAQAGARWTIAEMTPGDRPLRNLAEALRAVAPADQDLDATMLAALLARGPRSVVKWCRAGGLPSGTNLLILVDQFEELFRYGDYAAREEAEAFVGLLLESARAADAPIHIVLTMRSEYLGACALIPGLAEEINTGFYLTPRMSREECRFAIEGPAAMGGFEIEPALVNQILNAMAGFAPWEEERGVAQGQLLSRRADQLPLMQHLLNRIWLRASARAGDGPVLLKLDDYEDVGGLVGALDAHGDEILASLEAEDQATVPTVFRALVSGPDPTNAIRRPCRFDELAAELAGGADVAGRIINAFRAHDCNFLRPPSDVPLTDSTLIDISHESLIRQWSALSGWLRSEARADANWQRLLSGMERHARQEGDLLHGLDLAALAAWWDAERPNAAWAARHGGRFEEAERFLIESREAERAAARLATDRASRERKRLIVGMGVLAVLLFATIALAGFSWNQAAEARTARDQARQAQGVAEARRKQADDALVAAGISRAEAEALRARAAQLGQVIEARSAEARVQSERAAGARREAEALQQQRRTIQEEIARLDRDMASARLNLRASQRQGVGAQRALAAIDNYCRSVASEDCNTIRRLARGGD